MIDYDDTYTNSPPVRDIWIRALPALADVKNGDYLSIQRLREAFRLEGGKKYAMCWPPANVTGYWKSTAERRRRLTAQPSFLNACSATLWAAV